MGNVSKYFVLLLCFFSVETQSFIYDVVVMRKWDAGRYRYFIGLSDFHDKKHKSNVAQLADLKKIFSRCSAENLKIGSEDVGSASVDRPASCGRFFVLSKGGVLAGFSEMCKSLDLNFTNFEYRYCRVAALGPVLNNLQADLNSSPSVRATHVADLIAEIETIFRELLAYQDIALLKDLYAHCIRKMKRMMEELSMYRFARMNVSDYLAAITKPENRLATVKKLLTFDSVLLDLRLLHDVVASENIPSYLAIAGGSHIIRVAKFLSKLGYEKVHGADPKFVKEFNLEKCLGSNIVDGQYCRRPKPVDINLISDFL